jgi:hypothetical protein
MRRLRTVLAPLILVVCLTGCGLNQAFVQSVDETWQVIGPRYAAYTEADPDLDEDTKRIRLRSVETFGALIEEAKKQ